MSSPISTCECLKEPVSHIHSLVAAESELRAEAVEVLKRLGGHVVEVAEMPHRVEDGEEECCAGHDLVEDDVRVKGDVLVEGPLLHLGDQVPVIVNNYNSALRLVKLG